MSTEYEKAGVEARKKATAAAVKEAGMSKGMYPDAFCVIVQCPTNKKYGMVLHADGAGSKSIVNYLMYKENEDPSWFKYNASDVLAMNLDDVICVGATSENGKVPFYFSNTVGINSFNLDKEKVLTALFSGYKEYISKLKKYGVVIQDAGGETADLPDQIGTAVFDGNLLGYVRLSEVIDGSKIEPGNFILGLRSYGQSKFDDRENSGLMSNGLTLARTLLISNEYQKKYPEVTTHPKTSEERYHGRFDLTDKIEELGMSLGEALTSPTRIFAPVVASIIEQCDVTGLVHITGGGMSKPLNLGKNVKYRINMTDTAEEPPIFKLIQKEGRVPWREMYQDYNMGIGFLVILDGGESINRAISLAEKVYIGCDILGVCDKSDGANKIELKSPHGKFTYI